VTDVASQPTELCGATASSPPGKTLFGQPRGLATLFFTEMWERFTYYGMRAILILFMVSAVAQGGLGIDDKTASSIYGLFVAGSYLFRCSGWIADRLIGGQRAVIGGGGSSCSAMCCWRLDHASILHGTRVDRVGRGIAQPMSAPGRESFPEGGSRRDAGFSLFYMGINVGAF